MPEGWTEETVCFVGELVCKKIYNMYMVGLEYQKRDSKMNKKSIKMIKK
jgi:hypothetical protein